MNPLPSFLLCLRKHSSALAKLRKARVAQSDVYTRSIRVIADLDQAVANARESVCFYARHARQFASFLNR